MTISSLKTQLALILVFFSLSPTFGYGQALYESDPCCPKLCNPCVCWCSGFEVGADFIYWKPCLNDLDYAIKFDTDPNTSNTTSKGSYENLDHGFEPGFRVYGLKKDILCGWDVWGSYTWLWAKTSESVVLPVPSGMIFSTLDHAGLDIGGMTQIDANHTFRYQSFDVLFRYEFKCFGPCNSLIPFWGIEGIKINQDTDSFAVGEFVEDAATYKVRWDSEVLALGLKIGTEYRYTICNGIKWFTNASLSVVGGNNDTVNTQRRVTTGSFPTDVKVTFKDCTDICIPGCHLMAGLSYEKDWCGMVLRARIGYEFLEWWNVPRIRRFFDSGDEIGVSTGSLGSNLALHGLFVGLDVGF